MYNNNNYNNNNIWDTANAVNLARLTYIKELETTIDNPEERKRLLAKWDKRLKRRTIITWLILLPFFIAAIIFAYSAVNGGL